MVNELQEKKETASVYVNLNDFNENKEPFSKFAKNEESGTEQAQSLRQAQFDRFLVEAIDEALSTLGEAVKNTIYEHLERDFGISKNEIPTRIDEFSDIMHKIFRLGASRLEIKFIKNLDSKIKSNCEGIDSDCSLSKWIDMELSFVEYLKMARKEYEEGETKNQGNSRTNEVLTETNL